MPSNKEYDELSSNSIKFYQELAKEADDEKVVKLRSNNDNTLRDFEFIRDYVNEETSLLDLGSGTGLMVNRIFPYVKRVVAVELFEEFSKFIRKEDNIEVVNENIQSYLTGEQFDVITMFGVSQYFNLKECRVIFENILRMLKPGGVFILKNQFGTENDVFVSSFSEELGREYHSEYRHLDKEMGRLKDVGFRDVSSYDIYPPECNRWDSTHFYAIVCKR